jgi:uncharacterized lipoprotein YajG
MKLMTASKFVLIAAVALSVGCAKKPETAEVQKAQTANDVAQAVSQATTESSNGSAMKPAAHAISAQNLSDLLPNISGYTASEPNRQSMTIEGNEYSSAGKDYRNGEKLIKVSYYDYNNIQSLSAAFKMFRNFSLENETELQKSESIGAYPGWVNWKKKANEGQIGIVVNDRVYIVVDGRNGVTLDELRNVAKSMNLDALAKLSS